MSVPAMAPALSAVAQLRGVRAVLLTSLDDALPIASSSHVDVDVDALAAIGTTLVRRAHQTAEAAMVGAVRTIALEGEMGRLVAAAHGRLLLVALTERVTNPGKLRLALRRALEELA